MYFRIIHHPEISNLPVILHFVGRLVGILLVSLTLMTNDKQNNLGVIVFPIFMGICGYLISVASIICLIKAIVALIQG
jgi:hypothetical protein